MSYNASCAPSRLAEPRAKKRVMCASACVCKTPRKSAGCFKCMVWKSTGYAGGRKKGLPVRATEKLLVLELNYLCQQVI